MNDDEQQAAIIQWIRAHLGAEVTHIERQPRWRPAWFVEAKRAHERLDLYVRGERLDARIGFSLEHEMHLQKLLYEHDIPVARVHGWIDSPKAYVMDRVDGEEHLHDLPEENRTPILNQYMQTLARIHALDVEPFMRAGILRAEQPSESGRIGMEVYEKAYRETKKQPDPFLEFTLDWLRRNPLQNHKRESVILWDTGQFLHADGDLRAVIDLEIGHIGDPMMDLAGFRMRAREIGFDQFDDLYGAYEQFTETPVDRGAIAHHYFSFALCNQLAFHAALADPPPGSDYMMNLRWCVETNLYAIEALAEILDVTLEPVPPPPAQASRTQAAHAHLIDWLRRWEPADPSETHSVRSAFRLARHLYRDSQIGSGVESADLDDLAALLGSRPMNRRDGDRVLEDFVLTGRGDRDEDLVRLFHRRLSRELLTLGPEGSAMSRHHPVASMAEK